MVQSVGQGAVACLTRGSRRSKGSAATVEVGGGEVVGVVVPAEVLVTAVSLCTAAVVEGWEVGVAEVAFGVAVTGSADVVWAGDSGGAGGASSDPEQALVRSSSIVNPENAMARKGG